jgi:sterol desaturase/sphingolipid hydroxylase (fatty acid hydroxylase superfamily)
MREIARHSICCRRMTPPAVFDLSLNLYIIGAIAVVGPASMLMMDRAVDRAVVRGWLVRGSSNPAGRIGLADIWFMASFILTTGILASGAQLAMFHGRDIPLDLGIRPLEMLGFTMLLMLVVDTNGFFWHWFSHRNARAFRTFHSGHHRSKGKVHVAVAFYSNTLWDYPLHSGISLSLGLSLLVLATGHYSVFTIGYATTVYVLGVALTHSGIRETPLVKWTLFIVLLPIKLVPTAIRLEDHELHHARGDSNYGVFFSHWDRVFGTWRTSGSESELRTFRAPE